MARLDSVVLPEMPAVMRSTVG